MLSKGRNNEILAAWGEGNDPNTSVFGALDPAHQALRNEAIDSDTDEAWRLLMLAYWYQGQGREAEAAAVAQRLQAQFAGEMQAYHMAELYAHLGDDDRAFESLNRSWEKREAVMLDIKISADFQRLHDDPRYKALLKKMKLPE